MNETEFYLAGYQILKLKPLEYGSLKGQIIHTWSSCINFSIFDSWCQSWTKDKLSNQDKFDLNLNDENIKKIQKWTDEKFENISNLFPSLELAIEFKRKFLNNKADFIIYSINFSEKDSNLLFNDFREDFHKNDYNYNNGNFCLRKNLLKKNHEKDDEILLGFDIIGVECDGSFHSFHCNDMSSILKEKFNLILNKFGLYDEIIDSNELRNFLKDDYYFEPLPYYICKVKKVIE